MNRNDMDKILEIGVLLSSERDLNRLLERILTCVVELTHCDAGTLYLLDGNALRFKIMRNNTMHTCSGGDGQDPDLPPVPLSRENVCALALLESRTIVVDDVRNSDRYDFSGPIRYDAMTGYHTQSMLVVPMHNRKGEDIGVLQMINAMDDQGRVCGFARDLALMVESIASQAAITIQNVRYIEEIRGLFQSFVRVMSSAVDERTPYNGSHTRHMAACGDIFLDYLNQKAGEAGQEVYFTPERREELLMSIWFHDIGKLVTPLEVMNKEARLLPRQQDAFAHRMETIRLVARIRRLEGAFTREQQEETEQAVEAALGLVEAVNRAGFVTDDRLEALNALHGRTWEDLDGSIRPWLTGEEWSMLSIRKGTLSEEERQIMESHVVVTDRLLSQIRFSRDLSHVRQWAADHHELLNGSGYPRQKKAEEIPCEVRIITILDIFDALVADDRPYKPGMAPERAVRILQDMAEKEGKLDPELTRLFIESRCWEGVNRSRKEDVPGRKSTDRSREERV